MAKSINTGKSSTKPAAKPVKKPTKPGSQTPTKAAEKALVAPKVAGAPQGVKAIVAAAKAKASEQENTAIAAAKVKAENAAKAKAEKAAKANAAKSEIPAEDIPLPTELEIFNVVHKQWNKNAASWKKQFELPDDDDDAKTVLYQKVRYGKIALKDLA